jgi:RND superfamily putative drug exporter
MLGLAVGIDYSLFILNRHRRQLKAGMPVAESIALANGTSGNSVTFAGLTVIIALAALNLTGIDFLGLMGSVGAAAIAIAVAVAVTFNPAVISLIGMRVLSTKERRALADRDARESKPSTTTASVFATRHPLVSLFATLAVLGIAAIPLLDMRLGLPDGSSEPTDSTGYKSYKLTQDAFGEGVNATLLVVASSQNPIPEDDELAFQAGATKLIMGIDNVESTVPGGFSDDRTIAIFRVVPAGGPNDESTQDVVHDIRALDEEFSATLDSSVNVTGMAPINIDVSEKLSQALPIYLGTVIGLSLLIMMLVFRSIWLPLIASAGFLFTVFATLGAVTAVFQWGWLGWLFDIHDPAPILSFLPTMLIGILFGLAMDYQLFLASGMREAFIHGKSATDSINYGLRLSRSVVTAAAIIMVSVFGGFVFSHTTMIRPVGFGLAVGVLIDAFLVRLVLVPAALKLLGPAAWWLPKWLERILPDVDVEGAKLERSIAHH